MFHTFFCILLTVVDGGNNDTFVIVRERLESRNL